MVWFQFSDAGITFKPHTLGEYLTKHGIFPLFTQIYLKFSQVANNFFPDYKSTIGSLAKIWKIQKEYWPKKKKTTKKQPNHLYLCPSEDCVSHCGMCLCVCVCLCVYVCVYVLCVLRTCFEPLSKWLYHCLCESSRIWGRVKHPMQHSVSIETCIIYIYYKGMVFWDINWWVFSPYTSFYSCHLSSHGSGARTSFASWEAVRMEPDNKGCKFFIFNLKNYNPGVRLRDQRRKRQSPQLSLISFPLFTTSYML